MVHEFLEYRPYVSIRQFRREMAKYVDEATIAGYEKYVFVPIAVDECDAETFMQIPGVTEAIAADLVSGRPHGSNDAFLTALERHIGSTGVAKAGNFLATP
jgi:radical SAM superfamily enzyme with C-terminal helix-hairpin-helix motif